MAGGTDAHQPHPPTQASGQIDAESGGAGQCEKVVHSRCRRACVRASKDPLRSLHPYHRPCPRRSETDARQHRLQHGPPDLPRTSRNHGMSPFRNGRKRHANTLDRSKDGARPALRTTPAAKPPKAEGSCGCPARRSTMENHLQWDARLGTPVLISACWYEFQREVQHPLADVGSAWFPDLSGDGVIGRFAIPGGPLEGAALQADD